MTIPTPLPSDDRYLKKFLDDILSRIRRLEEPTGTAINGLVGPFALGHILQKAVR